MYDHCTLAFGASEHLSAVWLSRSACHLNPARKFDILLKLARKCTNSFVMLAASPGNNPLSYRTISQVILGLLNNDFINRKTRKPCNNCVHCGFFSVTRSEKVLTCRYRLHIQITTFGIYRYHRMRYVLVKPIN